MHAPAQGGREFFFNFRTKAVYIHEQRNGQYQENQNAYYDCGNLYKTFHRRSAIRMYCTLRTVALSWFWEIKTLKPVLQQVTVSRYSKGAACLIYGDRRPQCLKKKRRNGFPVPVARRTWSLTLNRER